MTPTASGSATTCSASSRSPSGSRRWRCCSTPPLAVPGPGASRPSSHRSPAMACPPSPTISTSPRPRAGEAAAARGDRRRGSGRGPEEPGEADAEGGCMTARPVSNLALGVLAVAAALIVAAIVVFTSTPAARARYRPVRSRHPRRPPRRRAIHDRAGTGATARRHRGRHRHRRQLGLHEVCCAQRGRWQAAGAARCLHRAPAGVGVHGAEPGLPPPASTTSSGCTTRLALRGARRGGHASGGTVSPVAVALPTTASSYPGIVVTLESSSARRSRARSS